MKSRSRYSSSLAVRSILLFASMAPVFGSLFSVAFATTWDPNNNPTWTSGSATLSVNIIGGTPIQTGGDISSSDLIQFGGQGFGALYTIGGGTLTVGGIWVGRIGDPPSQFVQNAGTVTVGQLEITDENGHYFLNGGTLTVNHVNFDYPGGGSSPGGGSLVLNGGTLVTSTIALHFGSGYVGRLYFNGGTLKVDPAVASYYLGWIQSGSDTDSQIYIYVGQNGGQFDTNGTGQSIFSPLLHDPAVTGTDGGITKLGAGTLTLAGDNTYTGVTTISAGTLQIGNGGTTGSILGNVTNNATLIFNRGNALTYGGVISGTGNLVKNGGGALTLSGFNTFTGGTTVNAGTLKLTAGGGIGTIRGALTINPGTVVESDAIDAFGYVTGSKVDSIVVNGGTIVHTAAGNLGWGVAYTLSNGALLTSNGGVSDTNATSLFAFGGPIGGNTSVNVSAGVNTIAGHVDLRGDSDSFTVPNTNVNFTVASGATLNIPAGISSHNYSTGAPVGLTKLGPGLMTFTGANTYSGPTIISAGTLQIGDGVTTGSVTSDITNNAALIFNQPAGTSTYAGVISGTGSLTKAGTGVLTFSSSETYTGPTTLASGTLNVNGALASTTVSVQSGATLAGTGSLQGVATLHIGGHIAPGSSSGSSTGTLTFADGIAFESGAVLDLQVGTASDLIRVSGGTLTGPTTGALTLNIFDSGGFGAGTYPIFDYRGATLASFDAADLAIGAAPAGFNYTFATNDSELDLIVTVPEPGPASMLLFGAGVLGLTRRRKAANRASRDQQIWLFTRSGWPMAPSWDPRHLVFLDETGLNTKMARLYGRAPRSERCQSSVPHGHWSTSTFIAALRHDGLTAPWLLDGPMDRAAFTTYIEDCLGPTLSPGDIVIADNLSSHKGPAITAAIERYGAKLVYLPPYSPDLNPIELAFSKLKAYLRAAAGRTLDALLTHLIAALDTFLPQHCLNFFRHCNYATT